jgi:putative ABC transport system permease protein
MRGDFWRRLRPSWLAREDIEEELDDELEFHIEMRTQELVDEGVEPGEAHAQARRDFGDAAAMRRHYVRSRGRTLWRSRAKRWSAELVQDVRIGARALRRRPLFAATATLVLALGIGAPTTVFTLVDTIFFQRPAHVDEPHRLLRVFRSWGPGQGGGSLGHPDYLYYRDNASTLSGLAAYGGATVAAYRLGDSDPDQLSVLHVSADYFDVLGVEPALGRTFAGEENETPGTHPVAVLSSEFWSTALGADASVVGRTITLNGTPYAVVGVAPEGFAGVSPVERAPDAWVPLAMFASLRRMEGDEAWWARHPAFVDRWLDVVGRVADGVTLEAATANLIALGQALSYEGKDPNEGVLVTPQFLYRPGQEVSLRSLSGVLLGVVLIVLLVAASNVAVLLLSRASTRHREIGIRTAVGAGRGRLLRQLLAESLLLGTLGGALGIACAYYASGLAGTLLPLPFDVAFVPDLRVLLLAVGLTLITSVLVGLAPALHAMRTDVSSVMHDALPRGGPQRARSALVVVQVGLSLVLVAGAVLFARSFQSAQAEELGFRTSGVLIAEVDLGPLGYDAESGRAFLRDALDRLRGLPGVVAASAANRVPFRGESSTEIDAPPGAAAHAPDRIVVGVNTVAPGYFDLMDVEIVAGRPLGEQDRAGSAPSVVINETLAGLLWPDGNAIGQLAPFGGGALTVVGIARDATYYDLGEDQWSQAYRSLEQASPGRINFLVETAGRPSLHAVPVQSALRAIEPNLAFANLTTIDALVEEQVARYEVSAVLVGLFSVIALVLAAAGLYGVIAFLVSQRSREIGVRMALGADRMSVAWDVVGAGLRLAGVGVAVGLVGVIALRGYTAALLYGVEASDPVPLVVACLTLLAVTALASAGPARQATRVDPIEAMRTQ